MAAAPLSTGAPTIILNDFPTRSAALSRPVDAPYVPVDWRQGASPTPIGDPPVNNDAMMKHQRAALIVGVGTFLLTKFGFSEDTAKSVLVGVVAGGGTYAYLTNRTHQETTWY